MSHHKTIQDADTVRLREVNVNDQSALPMLLRIPYAGRSGFAEDIRASLKTR